MHPIIQYIKENLAGYYPETEIASMAKWLLQEVFGFGTLELYGGKDRSFSSKEQKQLDDILDRLKNFEPLQYILGVEIFHGLEFEVTPSVLIPRPETAELIDWIIADHPDFTGHLLDVGTGSGCIPISLAKEFPHAHIESWDVSTQALAVAERNAKRNEVEVHFKEQDILVFQSGTLQPIYEVMVSNPPYIAEKEKATMEPNVLEWEPSLALFVPDADPLLFYRTIATHGLQLLKPKGTLYFEINQVYGQETEIMLENMGYTSVELRKDLFGNDRMLKALR